MTSIREYIFSLMIISISCAAVNMLTADNSSVSKYVRFLVSLIVTTVLLSPLQSAVGEIPELFIDDIEISFDGDDESVMVYADPVIEEACRQLEEEIIYELENRLSATPARVQLLCNTDDIENIVIEKISVIYPEYNKMLFSDTEKYIEDTMECECEVVEADESA